MLCCLSLYAVNFDEAAAADGECVDLSRSSSDGEQDADADNHAVLGKGAYGGSKSKFRDKHKQRRRQAAIPLHKKHLGFDGDADVSAKAWPGDFLPSLCAVNVQLMHTHWVLCCPCARTCCRPALVCIAGVRLCCSILFLRLFSPCERGGGSPALVAMPWLSGTG